MAFTSEIDAWLRNTPAENTTTLRVPKAFSRRCMEFHKKSELLAERAKVLISNSERLQEQIKRAQSLRNTPFSKPIDSPAQVSNGATVPTRRVG